MSQQEQKNETLAHRFHTDIFLKGKLEVVDEIIASDFVWRNPIIPSELQRGRRIGAIDVYLVYVIFCN